MAPTVSIDIMDMQRSSLEADRPSPSSGRGSSHPSMGNDSGTIQGPTRADSLGIGCSVLCIGSI